MKPAKIKVYLDSDVIISALRSKAGAANLVALNGDLSWQISDIQALELAKVCKRQGLKLQKYKTIKINVKAIFSRYVLDRNDVHIITGAAKSKAKFLITYNLKHYLKDKIKEDLDIVILTPGQMLQYLRSRE
jgi:predicted nucleic acid-binding protein